MKALYLVRAADPRHYQIAILSALLAYGILELGFPVPPANAAAIIVSVLGTQWLAGRWIGLERYDPLSPLITSLSLCLLLRTDTLAIAALAAVAAIAGKFLLRINGKHVFNPANFALVGLSLVTDAAWLSSGQWGNATLMAFGFACLGLVVLTRARRAETTIAFLSAYAALLIGRALWLGDPVGIPLHQLKSGALLLFAFFMISDPKTAPDSATGRIVYGTVVAAAAYVIQFVFFEPHGPVIALFLCAPLVPAIDFALRGRRYRWQRQTQRKASGVPS